MPSITLPPLSLTIRDRLQQFASRGAASLHLPCPASPGEGPGRVAFDAAPVAIV
jgi:hypothetical protein